MTPRAAPRASITDTLALIVALDVVDVLDTATAGVVTFEAAVVVITVAGVLALVVVDNGGDADVVVDVSPAGRPMPASMGASINATIDDSLNGNGVVSEVRALVDVMIDVVVVVGGRIIFPTRPLSSRPILPPP